MLGYFFYLPSCGLNISLCLDLVFLIIGGMTSDVDIRIKKNKQQECFLLTVVSTCNSICLKPSFYLLFKI